MKLEEYYDIVNTLKSRGLSSSSIKSFIINNQDIIYKYKDNFCSNLFFVYNNKDLYSILFVVGDHYLVSLYDNGEFSRLNNDRDLIVDGVISYTRDSKFNEIEDTHDLDLKDKVKLLIKYNTSSHGYHVE